MHEPVVASILRREPVKLRMMAGLIAGGLFLAGCASGNSGSGGGWHYSDSNHTTDSTKKATFGFRWTCNPDTEPESYSGQLDFIDRGAQINGYTVSFHASIKNASSPLVDCNLEVPYGTYVPPYRPQPGDKSAQPLALTIVLGDIRTVDNHRSLLSWRIRRDARIPFSKLC